MRWFAILILPAALCAQDVFVGAGGGIATLSADAATAGSPPSAMSVYKPENGGSLLIFGGAHFTDYFSAQASYSRNANGLTLSGTNLNTASSFEQPARAVMQTLGFEAMSYFRASGSRVRPYLSAGPVVTWFRARESGGAVQRNDPRLPPTRISQVSAGLRVAVGLDLRVNAHMDLRYTFSETLQANAVSRALEPAGQRRLANFQNLWGVVFRF